MPMPAPEQRTAAHIARHLFGAGSTPQSLRRAIVRWLGGAVCAAVLLPLLFYLRFGTVGPLGWGLAVFLAAFCLLAVAGLYFLRRPEFHTPVALRNDWLDHIGAFWL